jgi:hypothetical protein
MSFLDPVVAGDGCGWSSELVVAKTLPTRRLDEWQLRSRLCENASVCGDSRNKIPRGFTGDRMKRFVEATDRQQSTLFPAVLDEYVGENNPVRAIDVFVDGLDLAKLGFDGVAPLATGRPAYHPATLLKVPEPKTTRLKEKIAKLREESGQRNGAARAGLQHEAGDADSGRWRIDGRHAGLWCWARPNQLVHTISGCRQSARRSILELSQRRFAKSSPAPSRTQSR